MAEWRGCRAAADRAVEALPRGGIDGAWWMGYRVVEAMVCGGDIIGWRSIIAPVAACAIDSPSPTPGTALIREFSPRWNGWPSSFRSSGSVSSVVVTTMIVHLRNPWRRHWGRVGGCADTERGRARRHPRGPLPGFPCRPPHSDRSPARRIAGPSHSPATPGFHTQNRLCACITRGLPDSTPGSYTDWGRFACGTRELPAGTPEVYTRRGRLACITREYRPVPPPG